MTMITLSNVDIDFPVYSSKSRGLLNTILGYGRGEQSRIRSIAGGALSVSALRDINVSLRDGDRVGLVGRNGAGKTTLLRVMSGVYEPTKGHLDVSGNVSSLTDMFLGMDGDATGYENIVMRALFLGFPKSAAIALRADVEDFTELGEHLALPVRTYSSGMMLRLGFAISTALRPDILIMDEMIGAGDFHFRERAQKRLDAMLQEVKILVIASHDAAVIRTFCNRAIWLDAGRIVFSGAVEEVLAAYHGAA
jgi:ABC-type polysaccharide/polyol phosphate transport system ATPase subunit